MFKDFEIQPSQEDLDYFNLISFDRIDTWDSWMKIGYLCYSLYGDQKFGTNFLWHLSFMTIMNCQKDCAKEIY